MIVYRIVILYFLWCGLGLYGYSMIKRETVFEQGRNEYILKNNQNKVICKKESNGIISQHYFARDKNDSFKEIVVSFSPDSNVISKLYDTRISSLRYLISEIVDEISYDKYSCSLVLSGNKCGVNFQQSIQLQGDNNIYCKIECTFPEYVNAIDYIVVP